MTRLRDIIGVKMNNVKSLIKKCADKIEHHSFTSAYNKTFELIHCDSDELKDKTYRMRHRIYCQEYGHECPVAEGSYLEHDQFDERAVHFMLRHKISNEITGSLRVILPNDERPGESFPAQQQCDHPFLQSDSNAVRVCEISRFCMAPRFRQRAIDGDYLSSYHAPDNGDGHSIKNVLFARRRISYPQAALLRGAFETALGARIMDCIWMVEQKHLPSLQQIGFDYRILGPHLDHHGGVQPLIFNIKHVLDVMQRKAPAVWDIISDGGRLQHIADQLAHDDWQDRLISEDCLDKIYRKLTS